jgi:hypothetical protein
MGCVQVLTSEKQVPQSRDCFRRLVEVRCEIPSGRYEFEEDDDVSSEVRREKTLLNMLNLNCKRKK